MGRMDRAAFRRSTGEEAVMALWTGRPDRAARPGWGGRLRSRCRSGMKAVTSLYTDGADPAIRSILARASDGSGYDALAVDLREEEIVLETDRYRIAGKLTLPREGYRSRLSDYVNQRDREFFALSAVTI